MGAASEAENIKNLLSVMKSTKFKKPKLTKSNSSGLDFLNSEAKEAFIYLQKAFIKAPILYHFVIKCHIWIETDTSGYVISEVLS